MVKSYKAKIDFDFEIEREDSTIKLKVEGYEEFYPGRYSAAPEDCFPDDFDSEISISDSNGKDWSGLLTKTEEDLILTRINKQISESLDI